MRYSQLFTKTQKFAPADEVSKNAQLLIRGGFIHKEMAGVYDLLPLGLRVIKKIENIIREEMNAIGGQEVELASLQSKELWEKTNRWDEKVVDVWFKTKLNGGGELGLGFTHEEPLTRLMAGHINSYRDLPKYVYQFQNKFRNETRAKSGIMRGREFLMKDLYSFSASEEEHNSFYELAKQAYFRVFERIGLAPHTFLTFASGGVFSKFSHEFQTITEAGEDTIYLDRNRKLAVNKEILSEEVLKDLDLDKNNLEEIKSAEVGNIFSLGTRFSEPLELFFETEGGEKKPVIMGSYGIGLGRLMGTIVEVLSDEKGIIWPETVAPFQVYLVGIGEEAIAQAEDLYRKLTDSGIEVFLDDRAEISPGAKFADADLLGMPYRIVVSDKTISAGGVGLKKRAESDERIVAMDKILAELK